MACAQIKDLIITKGDTFSLVLRWESLPFIYTDITAINQDGPVMITAPGHTVPDGWRVAILAAKGMVEINSKNMPPRAADFHKATYVSGTQITLNDTSSSDFTPYTSGGDLVYYTPVSLAAATGSMQIRSSPKDTGAPLLSLLSPADIVFDNVAKTITITISATVTAAFTFSGGVYDFEVSIGGVVTKLIRGSVIVSDEVTK